MVLSVQESFNRSCRLCAEEQEVSIMIFSAEAEAMLLKNKLNKYLLLEIEEDDKLPKNVCLSCCSKLQNVSNFIDMAHKTQEVLLSRSLLLCDGTIGNSVLSSEFVVPDIKSEPITLDDDSESGFTQMEVSVDPMMVLQNSDSLVSPHIDDNANDIPDDITYLNGVDGEKVTIKLIRKDEMSDSNVDVEDNTSGDGLKPFSCIICKRSYLTELALKNHSWTHASEDFKAPSKEYECETCNESFPNRSQLMIHMKQHRFSNSCDLCGRYFRSERNLQVHKESHKISYKSHVCKICGRSYDRISNLKTHSVTHSTERPFKCHLCKKSFKRNQDLKFHINQHTGAKPYKCPFCDKCFASSGNCYSHRSRMHPGRKVEPKPIRGRRRMVGVGKEAATSSQQRLLASKLALKSVNGVYKFQCQICDHSFMRRDNFTYHMFQHTGEKPFQCAFCPEKFVTKKGLLLHHEKLHKTTDRPLVLLTTNKLLH